MTKSANLGGRFLKTASLPFYYGAASIIPALLICALAASAAGLPEATLPPAITNVTSPILAGDSFVITGSGFIAGSVVNLFVATATGPVNVGPLMPSTVSPNMLVVPLAVSVQQAAGVASVQVVNTDGHGNPINQPSNVVTVLLQVHPRRVCPLLPASMAPDWPPTAPTRVSRLPMWRRW